MNTTELRHIISHPDVGLLGQRQRENRDLSSYAAKGHIEDVEAQGNTPLL